MRVSDKFYINTKDVEPKCYLFELLKREVQM